ncbi:response regulator [Allosphingosinicella flava]|uniref:Response regulator n=1 Tax=Allosphingosinicella flava TaxID=2771430 RepID=A0A7T2GJK4_9SPHN|nr:response regulator [Sphingosinicella flava]QPQ55039.1 response regulator [Sphingosinicella flava]
MLNILIVEDEPLLARTLKQLVELNPRYIVTAVADDVDSAIAAVEDRRPDLALVDLQLARGSTGFSVAAKLAEMDIACLFTSGKAPPFPMPDLALGCLAKPFAEEDLVRALKTAEDLIRGRERLRPSLPAALSLYKAEEPLPAPGDEWVPDVPDRRPLWVRIRKLFQRFRTPKSALPV